MEDSRKEKAALRKEIDNNPEIDASSIYRKYQSNSGFKVGDRVSVVDTAESKECGWDDVWVIPMTHSVGKEYTILQIHSNRIGLDNSYSYPYFVLEPVAYTLDFLKEL